MTIPFLGGHDEGTYITPGHHDAGGAITRSLFEKTRLNRPILLDPDTLFNGGELTTVATGEGWPISQAF